LNGGLGVPSRMALPAPTVTSDAADRDDNHQLLPI
jgi:hypothetical protein